MCLFRLDVMKHEGFSNFCTFISLNCRAGKEQSTDVERVIKHYYKQSNQPQFMHLLFVFSLIKRKVDIVVEPQPTFIEH